jgi:outer membrane protein
MRVDKAIVIIIAALVLVWGLGADDKGMKIGIVDLDQAVVATEEGKKARDEFDRKRRDAEAQLQPMVEQFQEMMKEFEAKKFVLSDDALRAKQLDAAELRNRIENKQKEVQSQLEVDRERLVGPLRTKLVSVVEKVGRDEGFSLIFMRNTPGIMYTREALDITELIIKKFNEKS